jgi:FtsZ-binding cell division protein ZapB
MVTEQNPTPQVAEKKKGFIVYILAIVLLIIAISVLGIIHINQKKELKEVNAVLTEEKDSLTRELNNMIYGYDTLKTANESLSNEMQVQQDKIRELLALQASNAQLIKKYKTELGTLREIMKSYIVQIDSLNTRNKMLTAENIDVKSKLHKAEETNVQLTQKSEELSSKVEIASVILAKDMIALPINQRGKEATRISKITQVRICFTLRENPIAMVGNRTVYVRIIRPDDLILATTADDLFDFLGEKIVYSAKRDVEYLNQDIEMCIYWDNNGQLIPGTYTVDLFTDGNKIGSTTFMLK